MMCMGQKGRACLKIVFTPFAVTKDSPCINSIKELIEKNKAVAYNMFNKGAGR